MLHSLQICSSSVFKSWGQSHPFLKDQLNSYRSAANAAYSHVMNGNGWMLSRPHSWCCASMLQHLKLNDHQQIWSDWHRIHVYYVHVYLPDQRREQGDTMWWTEDKLETSRTASSETMEGYWLGCSC